MVRMANLRCCILWWERMACENKPPFWDGLVKHPKLCSLPHKVGRYVPCRRRHKAQSTNTDGVGVRRDRTYGTEKTSKPCQSPTCNVSHVHVSGKPCFVQPLFPCPATCRTDKSAASEPHTPATSSLAQPSVRLVDDKPAHHQTLL